MTEDRSVFVRPDQVVITRWIPVDTCRLACKDRMDFAAIERAGRRYLQAGECQMWPPIMGHWEQDRFAICDGRHEFLSLLALGKPEVFVGWIDSDKKDGPPT